MLQPNADFESLQNYCLIIDQTEKLLRMEGETSSEKVSI